MSRYAAIKGHSKPIEFVQFNGTNKEEVDKLLGIETAEDPTDEAWLVTILFQNSNKPGKIRAIHKDYFVFKVKTGYGLEEIVMSLSPEEFLALYKIVEVSDER